jgi:hypothetical protein
MMYRHHQSHRGRDQTHTFLSLTNPLSCIQDVSLMYLLHRPLSAPYLPPSSRCLHGVTAAPGRFMTEYIHVWIHCHLHPSPVSAAQGDAGGRQQLMCLSYCAAPPVKNCSVPTHVATYTHNSCVGVPEERGLGRACSETDGRVCPSGAALRRFGHPMWCFVVRRLSKYRGLSSFRALEGGVGRWGGCPYPLVTIAGPRA